MLAIGFLTPLVAAAIVAQAVVIIGRAHWANGFFNQRSGIEYPLLLGAGAAALGLAGPSVLSVDSALGFVVDPTIRVALVVAGIIAGLVVLTIPRLGTQPARRAPDRRPRQAGERSVASLRPSSVILSTRRDDGIDDDSDVHTGRARPALRRG
jgi:putative oxidoreductase